MPKEIYTWRMSASMHAPSIRSLAEEIIEANTSQTPLPVEVILDLLPLQTNQDQRIRERGEFVVTGNHFENIADSELFVEFYDPVIEDFNLTLPEVWKGKVLVSGDEVDIVFENPLEINIPKISEIGVDRSSFQLLVSLHVTKSAAVSKYLDDTDSDKETWVVAELSELDDDEDESPALIPEDGVAVTQAFSSSEVNPMFAMASGSSGSCGGGDSDPDWYVYRKNGGLCLVHKGIIVGGSLHYTEIYGPDFKTNCDKYLLTACNDGFC